ncbi:MAG: enoyl-CoA hydratase/isomerase family protein [Halanaerobiales bacterium]
MGHIDVKKEENIAILTINRPETLNSLDKDILIELGDDIQLLEEDKDILIVIITGAGKAFVAGADIASMVDMDREEAGEFSSLGHGVLNSIQNSRLIIIAAINGYALGGGNELALACDIRIASEKAIFSQPEVGLGIIAGFGGTQRLARLVGEGKASELLFSGRTVGAEEADEIGLVNSIVASDELLDKARELAHKIANNGPLALRKTKEAINYGMKTNLEDGLSHEIKLFSDCFSTNEQKEGMTAFLQKKKADFSGK